MSQPPVNTIFHLPIQPTQRPNGADISKVGVACIDIAQRCLLSPAAVVSALRMALDVYSMHLEARGFAPELIAECEQLGAKMAQTFEAQNDPVTPEAPTGPRLVGVDGLPLG